MKTSVITYLVSGIAAFLFSSTGPVAIIMSVANSAGLSNQHVASWLFGGFGIAGAYSLYFTIKYRQPIAFAWTIPGTVLLLAALQHLEFEEAVGAYIVTAVCIFLIGVTGFAQKIVDWIPKPIVMAMVAGIFLQFGLNLIAAFEQAALMSWVMVISFVVVSAWPALQRFLPPILVALVLGVVVLIFTQGLRATAPLDGILVEPLLFTPIFTWQALLELVVPLVITVVVVQNGQGFAVLTHAGHNVPVKSMTMACGTGSILLAFIGAVSMCVTGPTNAILSSEGDAGRQYIAGLTYGVLAVVFGICGALMAWVAFKLPEAYIAVLGGLAVYKVLESAFKVAFTGHHTMGALATLVITVSNISLFNIGAPFWGLVCGGIVSYLLDKSDTQN